MKLEEVAKRKASAVKLLEAHSDKYRLLYVDIVNVAEITDEEIEKIEKKRKMLDLESNAIHTQLSMLNELQYFAEQEAKAAESTAE